MRYLFFLAFFFLSAFSFAQTDTLFWFAAPEVTESHADKPVYLRICTFDQDAQVRISQPANPSFSPITLNVKANSTATSNLTSRLTMLENDVPDEIKNSGLLVETSSPVTVYYEVMGYSYLYGDVNTDIFTLKGRYALGTEFFTPFQNHWNNQTSINAYSSFDIVATEDNTVIHITPKNSIVGHLAGETFTVTLQRGQVYSARAISEEGSGHLHGSHITANKPVAVTVKDDSVLEQQNWDLLGDQLVPVQHIGREYIAVKISNPGVETDKLFIVATQDSTVIYFDGSATAADTLMKGDTYSQAINNDAAYILSSRPVYVWHVGGFGNELGGALLPEISCTGSRKVRFTRSNAESFALNILVRTSGTDAFRLNGKPLPEVFTEVPGTSGEWSYAKISYTAKAILSGSSNLLENAETDFHLGILNGEAVGTSFRYGYFSSFGFGGLTGDEQICPGETAVLHADENVSNYTWNTGATGSSISVQQPGTYWVRVLKGICEYSDTIQVNLNPSPEIPELGEDTALCAYEKLTIQPETTFQSYLWNTGSTADSLNPTKSGIYSLEVSNEFDCKAKDSIEILFHQPPSAHIHLAISEEQACKDSLVSLSANEGNFKYEWHNGDTTNSTIVLHEQVYSVKITDKNGCQDSTTYYIDCSPFVKVFNLMTPNGDPYNEVFYVEDLKPGKWTLEVYNRWGGRVYKHNSYDNSWTAENIEDGVYYYVLKHNEGKRVLKGNITILH